MFDKLPSSVSLVTIYHYNYCAGLKNSMEVRNMADGMDGDYFYEKVTEISENYFKSEDTKTVWELAETCMDVEGMPLHHPIHHYIVPAVLLAACYKKQGNLFENFRDDLQTVLSRAKNVLPGFCGWYGACGSCVGVGVFMSVFTKTDPHSKESWSWTNRATADALMSISEFEGPQCCKRNTYIALESAKKIIAQYLNIELEKPEKVCCKYNRGNKNCKGKKCSFFQPKSVAASVQKGESGHVAHSEMLNEVIS